MHAYIHTYNIHTYIPTVLPSRSFTTSFVFPSFSDPATTFETHYWKKLTCGVIRSFNVMLWYVMVCYGMLWYVMACYGMLWYVMVCYGMLWYVMVCYGMLWYVMVCNVM